MSTVKRISGGNFTIETVGAADNVVINSNSLQVANTLYSNSIVATQNSTFANVNIGNLSASGNVTAALFVGDGTGLTGIAAGNALGNIISYGTSNVAIPVLSGNVRVAVAGVANVAVFTDSGLEVTGTASASGNITGGNIITAGIVTSTGNVETANYFVGNGYFLTGISSGGQSNISNGTSNVNISTANGNIGLSVGGTANVVVVTSTGANIVGYANVTTLFSQQITSSGNVTAANFNTGGQVSATGNITGGNINTTTVSASGAVTADTITTTGNILSASTANIQAGNLLAVYMVQGTTISATGNLTVSGNVSTGGSITAPGNISGGNLVTLGAVSAAGNVTGSYILGNGALLSGISTGVSLGSRTNVSITTSSLANNASFNGTFTGYKGYALYKVSTSVASWVRVYTSSAAQSADSSRNQFTDPQPGAGVIAEVITTGANVVLMSPAALGFNDESSPSNTIPITVTNLSGSTQTVNVTFTVLQLEV